MNDVYSSRTNHRFLPIFTSFLGAPETYQCLLIMTNAHNAIYIYSSLEHIAHTHTHREGIGWRWG